MECNYSLALVLTEDARARQMMNYLVLVPFGDARENMECNYSLALVLTEDAREQQMMKYLALVPFGDTREHRVQLQPRARAHGVRARAADDEVPRARALRRHARTWSVTTASRSCSRRTREQQMMNYLVLVPFGD